MDKSACPVCIKGILERRRGKEIFHYKGESISFDDYVEYACNQCGESIVDNDSMERADKLYNEFKRRVDRLLTGEEIKSVREKLGFTQEEMSELLGGGKKSFAKYENNRICQSRAMDSLIRIVGKYPYVLDAVPGIEKKMRT